MTSQGHIPQAKTGDRSRPHRLLLTTGSISSRAGLALGLKLLAAGALVVYVIVPPSSAYGILGAALWLVLASVLLDYWVYRAIHSLFDRFSARLKESESQRIPPNDASPSARNTPAPLGIEGLMDELTEGLSDRSDLDLEGVPGDLYRLQGLNNQLIKLSELSQELNAALPYRETRMKALGLSRQLLASDLVALVAEEGGEFTLEGVAGCEESEVNLQCCGYYSKCPVKTAFRQVAHARTSDHECGCFPPSMRAHLALPFRLEGGRVFGMLAAAACPGAFDGIHPIVLENLMTTIATALSTAMKYDRIRREVATDPLTNLYNRRFFEKRAEEEVARSLRQQQPVTFMMLDVDHFKDVNDTYGHQTGDKVLQRIAQFLEHSVRQSDICGRYGGDEFVLLLPCTPGKNAVFLADRLRSGLSQIIYTGLGVPADQAVTVSGGLATCPRDGTTVDELIRRADEALYDAKRKGRNQIVRATIPTAGETSAVETRSKPGPSRL